MANGVSLVRVGDDVVLMIEVYPTAFMLALDTDQVTKLADGLREIVSRGGGEAADLDLSELLRGAGRKPEGSQ